MQKLACPFFKGQEVDMTYMFDTQSIPKEEQVRAVRILTWMIHNKDTEAYIRVLDGLKNILGEKGCRLFLQMYIETYNQESKNFKRYFYFKSQEYITYVFRMFQIINDNYSYLGSLV